MPHACFYHYSDTCSLGSNGSTKFLESLLSLIPFWRADPALVLECYPLKFFDDFKLKIALKHPFLKQAIHFNFLNSFLESNCRIF
jgi:hypothetical protein